MDSTAVGSPDSRCPPMSRARPMERVFWASPRQPMPRALAAGFRSTRGDSLPAPPGSTETVVLAWEDLPRLSVTRAVTGISPAWGRSKRSLCPRPVRPPQRRVQLVISAPRVPETVASTRACPPWRKRSPDSGSTRSVTVGSTASGMERSTWASRLSPILPFS